MNAVLVNSKKIVLMFMLSLIMCMTFLQTDKIESYAGNDIGDVKVEVNGSGGLSVSGGGMDYKDGASSWNGILGKIKAFVVGASGLCALVGLGFLIFNFCKLSSTATNPQERSKVLTGIMWSFIAMAGLGSVSIIGGFFYGILK